MDVDEAFDAAPRVNFLPAEQRPHVDLDQPLPLTAGQTCSQPSTVHQMLVLLDARPGHRVLDVGSGSGWTTALLAHLVGPSGRVDGVEIVPELATWGRANVEAAGLDWAHIHHAAPGLLGLPELAPFDRILVSAQADDLPAELVHQLADGGRMVVPVRSRMTVVDMSDGVPSVRQAPGSYRFVPLIERRRGRHRAG